MLNPPARMKVAYDSAVQNYFDPSLIGRLPVGMKPGDSLVSTISFKKGHKVNHFLRGTNIREGSGDDSPVRTAAVLTCLAEPAPPDAFRPSYCDRQAKIHLARDLRRDLLPRLPRPQGTIDWEDGWEGNEGPAPGARIAGKTRFEDWVRIFSRPWVNTCYFGFEIPVENMPHYGREICRAVSVAGLLLCCDDPPEQKERLLLRFVQVGIDYYGVVKSGHSGYEAWGGHNSGRKMPIVFAGILLGDEAMAAVSKTLPHVSFQEDEQTGWGESWTGAKAIFLGHSGINAKTGKPARPQWGPYEHLPPSKWNDGNKTSEAYRRTCSSLAWVGEALVLRLLKAEPYWNHDAFFAYVDRWMTEDDTKIVEDLKKAGMDYTAGYARQGQCWDPFVTQMWKKYRTAPGMPPTDGWKQASDKNRMKVRKDATEKK
jgi:hypothetical protein